MWKMTPGALCLCVTFSLVSLSLNWLSPESSSFVWSAWPWAQYQGLQICLGPRKTRLKRQSLYATTNWSMSRKSMALAPLGDILITNNTSGRILKGAICFDTFCAICNALAVVFAWPSCLCAISVRQCWWCVLIVLRCDVRFGTKNHVQIPRWHKFHECS